VAYKLLNLVNEHYSLSSVMHRQRGAEMKYNSSTWMQVQKKCTSQ